jgi:hypothetical protein
MNHAPRTFLLTLACLFALLGAVLGWTLATKLQDNACLNLLESAYKEGRAAGRTVGYAEAQQNGACLKWWTGSSTEGLQAAKTAFCKQR